MARAHASTHTQPLLNTVLSKTDCLNVTRSPRHSERAQPSARISRTLRRHRSGLTRSGYDYSDVDAIKYYANGASLLAGMYAANPRRTTAPDPA
ncbi:hypothetical protein MRX96_037273 [Rhipicephalus microplus]